MAKRKATIEETPTGVRSRISVAPDDPTQDTVTETVRAFIAQALQRWKLADEAETYNRSEGLTDLLMVDGEGQWDDNIRMMRQADKRPCITVNRFVPMIAYVDNEQRQARVGIQVSPVGGGADPAGARIRQGLIRSIEYDSHAEVVYDTAFEAMVVKGWSWLRVRSEYESDTSFHQILRIEGVPNDFSVYTDPTAKHPTRRDMRWGIITDDIPRGRYASLYPNSRMTASLSLMQGIGDDIRDWVTPDSVRVAEYYYIDDEDAESIQLVDGSGVWRDQLAEDNGFYYDRLTGDPAPVYMDEQGRPKVRRSRRRKVKWAEINAIEILDGNEDRTAGREIGGYWIPMIMVAGRERNVRGQRRLSGMIRHNREQQRVYNYLASAFIEAIALAPKAPFIAAAGQIEDFKTIWDTANEKNWPYLPYKPMTVDMQPVPAPQRQTFEPAVAAIASGLMQFDNMIKAGFNIYDPALGRRGSQESGKAMLIGKAQSESANMNWIDNLGRAIQHVGEVCLDLIPLYYDAPRTVEIVRPDNEREEVLINKLFEDPDGNAQLYDMARGKYSCVVTAGLANETKRQQAVEKMFGLMEADPSLFRLIGDQLLENMDWPGADRIAERLKMILPPEVRSMESGAPSIPPELQAQLDQVMQEFQALQQAYAEAQQIIESKQVETASKERIAELQTGAQREIAAAKLRADLAIARLQVQFKAQAETLKDRREREATQQRGNVKQTT